MMRLPYQRAKVLETINYFIPRGMTKALKERERVFMPSREVATTKDYLTFLGFRNLEQSPDGKLVVEAFFDYTERAIKPTAVVDIDSFVALLTGHKRMALMVKEWEAEIEDGMLSLKDFDDDLYRSPLQKHLIFGIVLPIFYKYGQI